MRNLLFKTLRTSITHLNLLNVNIIVLFLGFRNNMRRIRDEIKSNSNKIFVPYSFEQMMLAFGQNMQREEFSEDIDRKRLILGKLVKQKDTTMNELDKLINNNTDNFVKLIESNDVNEQDLQNDDNKLYQKLLEKSRSKMLLMQNNNDEKSDQINDSILSRDTS